VIAFRTTGRDLSGIPQVVIFGGGLSLRPEQFVSNSAAVDPVLLDQRGKYRVFTACSFDQIPQLAGFSSSRRNAMKAVASVLPFRTNNYVVDELIDWDNVPDDPMFQLTFPQPGMLEKPDFAQLYRLVSAEAPVSDIAEVVRLARQRMNPHPAGQVEKNVPALAGESLGGMQHKYRETVLFFPSPGQTCHAYCTYCFRWAQFV
jgi:L-lysine 2,3-aminomutase